jgi:hypothetical protein
MENNCGVFSNKQVELLYSTFQNLNTFGKEVSIAQFSDAFAGISIGQEKLDILNQYVNDELPEFEFVAEFSTEIENILIKLDELHNEVESNSTDMKNLVAAKILASNLTPLNEEENSVEVNQEIKNLDSIDNNGSEYTGNNSGNNNGEDNFNDGDDNVNNVNNNDEADVEGLNNIIVKDYLANEKAVEEISSNLTTLEDDETSPEMNQESENTDNGNLGSPNKSASNLTPENDGEIATYIPHPLLQKFPPLKEDEKASIDLNMYRNKKMLDPAFVFGKFLLSNVYQYQKAIEMGYEVNIQVWNGAENDIEALIEEMAFFGSFPNSTQRAIWAYKHLDSSTQSSKIKAIKKMRKGGIKEKFDARIEPARLYNTSIGYISKAGVYDREHHGLYEKCFAGDFKFREADKIVKFKESNYEFYNDLTNKLISIDEISKYSKFLSDDNALYRKVRDHEISFEQAGKLNEIQNYNFNSFEKFINGEIPLNEIESTLINLKEVYIMSKDSDTDNTEITDESKAAEGIESESTDSTKDIDDKPQDTITNYQTDDGLVISSKVRTRILSLAASQHKSVDEFLAELLDSYNSSI